MTQFCREIFQHHGSHRGLASTSFFGWSNVRVISGTAPRLHCTVLITLTPVCVFNLNGLSIRWIGLTTCCDLIVKGKARQRCRNAGNHWLLKTSGIDTFVFDIYVGSVGQRNHRRAKNIAKPSLTHRKRASLRHAGKGFTYILSHSSCLCRIQETNNNNSLKKNPSSILFQMHVKKLWRRQAFFRCIPSGHLR